MGLTMDLLWIDDQLELIRTFSVFLRTLNPRITRANDGEKAIEILQKNDFDLIICDLRMPPGDWGGLWFIEQIRQKYQIRTPILVLSGEGSQSETIKAMRLGANDYVEKENVEKELLIQIMKIINQKKDTIYNFAVSSFPSPMALCINRYKNANDDLARLHRLIEFYDCCLRFSCFLGLMELNIQKENVNLPERLLESFLRGPSLGNWNQMRIEISKLLNKKSVFFQINKSIPTETITSIIQIRNDIAHVTEPSSRLAKEHLCILEPLINSTIEKIWISLSFGCIHIDGQRFNGANFQIYGQKLIGDSSSLSSVSINSSIPLITDHVYLINNCKNEDYACIDLHPFIISYLGLEPSSWEILMYDCVRSNTPKPVDNSNIQYINLWSGKRNIIPDSKPTYSQLPQKIFLNNS
jgi:CheY-like chemotaxis protein